jgi:hypothetical protein
MVFIALFCFQIPEALTAKEIMQKVDTKKEPRDIKSDMTMRLINKKGKERKRKIRVIRKGEERQIMWFLEPADVKGTSFLKIEKEGSFDDMRLYLPAFKKVRRITSSAKSDKFMGSDFTYEDMTTREIEDYTYKLFGDSTIDNMDCYSIESSPKEKTDTDYGRVISWVWKDEFIVVYEKMFDKKGRMLKIKKVSDFKVIKDYQVFHRIEIENVKKKHRTVLEMDNISLDTGVKSSLFHERNLKRIPK